MKDWFKKNYMRVWVSGVAGLGFGALSDFIGSAIFGSVNGYVQLALIIGGAIGIWYVLKNNNGFGRV